MLVALETSPVRADEKADALLKEVEQTTRTIKTLTADLVVLDSSTSFDGKVGTSKMAATLKLKKPNLARMNFSEGEYAKSIASDGKNLYTLMLDNQYRKAPVDPMGKGINTLWVAPIGMFFGGQPADIFGAGGKPETAYMGRQVLDGVEYEVVQLKGEASLGLYDETLYRAE